MLDDYAQQVREEGRWGRWVAIGAAVLVVASIVALLLF